MLMNNGWRGWCAYCSCTAGRSTTSQRPCKAESTKTAVPAPVTVQGATAFHHPRLLSSVQQRRVSSPPTRQEDPRQCEVSRSIRACGPHHPERVSVRLRLFTRFTHSPPDPTFYPFVPKAYGFVPHTCAVKAGPLTCLAHPPPHIPPQGVPRRPTQAALFRPHARWIRCRGRQERPCCRSSRRGKLRPWLLPAMASPQQTHERRIASTQR